MRDFISVYQEHRDDIESFIIETLKNNRQMLEDEVSFYKKNFEHFPSMELLYITDLTCKQITPNIFRNRVEKKASGEDRSYLSSKLLLSKKDKNFSISSPYISSATGSVCITVMKREDNHYIFIDFILSELLSRLGLIELSLKYDSFIKLFYKIIGLSLICCSLLSIGYAFFSLFSSLVLYSSFTLESLFKPIVAITLGLAIFDLSKTILEREVFFKNYSKKKYEDTNILTKFLISIIIALSIEALMVVFKIALHDSSKMVNALYLIVGIGVIISSLGLYNYLSKKSY
jgi:hypothetical protein